MAGETLLGVPLDSWLLFILVIAITVALARLLYVLVRHTFDRHLSKRASKNLARIFQYLIIAVGVYWGFFSVLHLDITALIASLGIAGIAVAFASQEVLQNFIAGLLIVIERRIQLEDWIEIVGTTSYRPARISDITLTKTVLVDPGGKLVYVPNSVIIDSQVINYTQAGFFEVPVELRLSKTYDLEIFTALVTEVAEAEREILPNPHVEGDKDMENLFRVTKYKLRMEKTDLSKFSPRVLVTRVEGDDLVLSVRLWIMNPPRREEITSDFLKALLKKCDLQGIKFSHS
ncbi:MAG: mechanosensitive ion channel domain-containing protein [Methanomassiliicoccales archaeon]|jgi:small-conductance mechanosensitive channel